ncbi:hypothetical protein [Nonomuraea sp. NPDC049758]|uniref:hypothetical protein n=1 Tax=Nonomuraea sp. NPDC049758 TaxID=3154360 RepID=UPI00341AFCFC
MSLDVKVTGAEELGALAKRLKTAGSGKALRKELLKAIRTGAKPALADTRRAVRAIPVTGSRGGGRRQRERDRADKALDQVYKRIDDMDWDSFVEAEQKAKDRAKKNTGLRDTVARSLRLTVKTGSKSARVRIEVDSAKIPEGMRTLPRHLDSEKGWRHPLFGDREHWYSQRGRPWFASTIRRHLPALREHILKAMDDIAAKIEKEG